MLIVVSGGSASGKSEMAEAIACRCQTGKKIYLATMICADKESEKRIENHKKLREGKGFQTIEKPVHIEVLSLQNENLILLECMSNLLANEMYDPKGVQKNVKEHIFLGIEKLLMVAEDVVIVTNEIFHDPFIDKQIKGYIKTLGEINQYLAKRADLVIESVYSIPVIQKDKITKEIGRALWQD